MPTKRFWQRFGLFCLAFIFTFQFLAGPISAEKKLQKNIGKGINWLDPDCDPATVSEPKDTPAANAGKEGLTGSTDVEKAYRYLMKLGVPSNAAAGLVGNFVYEAGGEDVKTGKLDTREEYEGHTGIAQWDIGRWNKLKAQAIENNKTDEQNYPSSSPYSLKNQLDFVYFELTKGGYESVYESLKSASSPGDAATIANQKYEVSGVGSIERSIAAEYIALTFKGSATSDQDGGNASADPEVKDGVCCPDVNGNGGSSANPGGTSTGDRKNYMYRSGLPGASGSGQGEFILEQWAIHTLKSIAILKKIPESDTVTINHVVSLVAFAKGEGGDINNQWKFNPMNSGFPGENYVDGAGAGNGTQSFKSFDAGVSAASRHMTEGYQTRVGDVLSKPSSTPDDFIKAMVSPERTPGNLHWAEAANPASPHYRSDYVDYEKNLVKQVKENYKDIASITIGTPNKLDQQDPSARKPELLQFQDASGASAGEGDPSVSGQKQCCAEGIVNNSQTIQPSNPSSWKRVYETNKSVSDSMDEGKMDKPKALIIHYTAGESDGVSLFRDMASRGVGVQFNVAKNGDIYQAFPLDNMRKSSHVASFNSEAIGIEITGMDYTDLAGNDKQFTAVAGLSSYLCDKFDIPCSEPKGDITNSSIDQSQGMLGHDEVPQNDHSDPDAKTGEDIDRKDSSKHPYMMKLRKAMGFEETPGKGSADAAATPVNGSSPGCGKAAETGGADLKKTIKVKEGAEFIKLPSAYSCPGRETRIDARIAASLVYILKKYDMCSDDGLANGHKSHGAGLGVDIRPKDQSKQNSKEEWKRTVEQMIRDINWWGDSADEGKSQKGCAKYSGYGSCVAGAEGPKGKIPQWARWIGYNGDVDHGDPWHVFGGSYGHVHLGWDTPNHDGVAPSIISQPVSEVYTFPAPIPNDLNSVLPAALKDKAQE